VDADEDLRHSRAEDKPLNGRIDHLTELHAAKTSFVVQSLNQASDDFQQVLVWTGDSITHLSHSFPVKNQLTRYCDVVDAADSGFPPQCSSAPSISGDFTSSQSDLPCADTDIFTPSLL